MPDSVPVPETPGQHCTRWLKAAKKKAQETNTVLSWDEVTKIIDHTMIGLNAFPKLYPKFSHIEYGVHPGDVKAVSSGVTTAEDIYAAYPRKVGRKAAIDAIKRALKRRSVAGGVFEASKPAHLLNATKAFSMAVSKWPDDERNFCPHPATWFNQGRYDDDPKEWIRGTQPTPQKDYSKLA